MGEEQGSQPPGLPVQANLRLSIPDHELIRHIGRGSYGEVWLAKSVVGAFRAVKVVYERSFRHQRPFEREFSGVQKFEPVSRLHDGLMDVLQVGRNEADGYFYCIMELADDVKSGQVIDPAVYQPRTLAYELMVRKRLPVAECRQIGIMIASALDFLHRRGLLHRDIKPSNIVFVNGVPKLADIGLVAEMSEARSYVGTEGFIPPEGPGTIRADIYSLGKVLYEISTGKDRHDYPELPGDLGDSAQEDDLLKFHKVVLNACRADPQRRYQSARAIAASLQTQTRPEPAFGKRQFRLAGAILIVAALISAAGFFAKRKRVNVGAVPSARASSAKHVPVRSEDPSKGPAGYWTADGDALDEMGRNDGQEQGGLAYAPGKIGKAFLFDGTNSAVKIEAAPILNVGLGAGFTLSAWINPMDVAVRGPLFEWNDGNGSWGVHFHVDPSWHHAGPGALFANVVDTNFNFHPISSPGGVLVSNVFQHVALTYDKQTGEAKLYCNGAVVARETFESFTAATASDLYLGRRVSVVPPDQLCNFAGLIDEPAVFDRALSQDEIQTLYRAGNEGRRALVSVTPVPAPADLVAWWSGEADALDRVFGNSGVAMDGVAYTKGEVGGCFDFSGATNSYVEVPDSPMLSLTNELTIEFWVKRRKPFGSDYILNKGGDWTGNMLNYGIDIAPPNYRNSLSFLFAGGVRGSIGISDVRWHHCAITARNGDVDPIFFVDGVQQPVTFRQGEARIHLYPSRQPLYVGAQVDPQTGFFYYCNVLVDEVSIYRRVLSASEIHVIYCAGKAGKAGP